MRVALDLHDFSITHNRLLWLIKLKEKYPNFKVSLFTIPIDQESDWGPFIIRNEFLKEIKRNLDWLQIIPHGLRHNGSELKHTSYHVFTTEVIPEIKQAFERDGLPYVSGFCAPHFRWSGDVVYALDEMGWWGAITPRKPDMQRTKRFYNYTHAIDDFPMDAELLKLHGHVYGTRNDLALCFDKLMELPQDTEWHFVTDFIEEAV